MNGGLSGAMAALRALLAGHTQDTRLLRLTTSPGADALLVERIAGREGLSQGFRFDITTLSTDAALDGKRLLGQPALLEILTQHSRSELRPIHGHITAFEPLSSEAGLTRYRLNIEPWTAFLRHRFDSFVWQDKSTLDIVAEIFADYQGQGRLAPEWRLALSDASRYAPREVCTQFEESDWAFVERLLAEEGLFYWFEHVGDAGSAALGNHRLVIADSNAAFGPNVQPPIRFHRAAAVEQSDTITGWQTARRVVTNTVRVASWNERQVSVIGHQQGGSHAGGDVPELLASDHAGLRHFDSGDAAERSARLHLEALEARNHTCHGEGTVRTLAPGSTFVLTEHPVHDRERLQEGDAEVCFAVIAVQHFGRNNLGSDANTLIDSVFGNSAQASSLGGLNGQASRGAEDAEPLYRNRFTALRADIPWRPLTVDARGALLHPKPTVTGIHTAIVVGTPGQDLTTERNHRIKVQLHWQRGAQSHSRRSHPQGDNNTPAQESAYVWVRVMEPAAGPNWGSSFTPRIGQEVIFEDEVSL
ncbi:type VI secretion system Vgr family protein [Noviherbaspirillum sedimenti]|uniref:Type VI secretion system tip protein VgrG n=1 Tax=Noviherbaspirillum sedimenti TaxID=2320865 RepID=A0A3A3FY18_9BURK|nr:type VI secretion system Vgr family protein [Noviherbaspirillum sedimenti]RJG00511.1 type VI secretion system tip protein VgrG [Noviherbaspirillum sedimenti]